MLERLINAKGQPAFGYHPEGVDTINYLDFDLRSVMDRPLGRWVRKLKFNQFQFIGVTCPNLIVGMAIVDLQLVSNFFIYLFQPETGKFEEFSFIQPFARRTCMSLQPNAGKSEFRTGRALAQVEILEQPKRRQVQVELDSQLQIKMEIDEATDNQPMSLCTRAGYQGWVFTQKNNARPCRGFIRWNDRQFDLAAIQALASVDWSAGCMRRETFWNWASLSCRLPDGRPLGINLAAGVNETGFNENTVWLDGKYQLLPAINFQFDRYNSTASWQIKSLDNSLELDFIPKGTRAERRHFGILATNFRQYFGQFSGRLVFDSEEIELQDHWGFCEDHYAKW